ncbi:MAG: peptidoglycan DD-metalloendopeptidase family protein [Actinomycetes bacterium]
MRRPRPARVAGVSISAALAAGLLLAVPSSSVAGPEDRKREVDASIQDLRSALEGTDAALTAAAVSLKQTEARLPVAQAELEQAEAAAAEAHAKDVELAGRLAAATQSEAKARAAIEEGAEQVEATRRTLGQIASQAYRGGSLNPALAVALSSESPTDFADRYVMVDTALRSQNSTLARLGEQQALRAHSEARLAAVQDEIDRLKQEAAANLEAARAARAAAAERKTEVERLRAQQAEALQVIEARKQAELDRLDELERERSALEAELRRIAEEERRRAAAEARRRAAAEAEAQRKAASQQRQRESSRSSGSSSRSSSSPLSYPVNARISSHYGYRIHPIYGTRRLHAGTDFAAGCGTPVRAAADGRVVRAGVNGGYGNQIVLNHGTLRGESVATSYNHLSGYEVRSGSVSRGQVIGYIGTTGTSTGCHLHFEVYVNGSTVNPMGWL